MSGTIAQECGKKGLQVEPRVTWDVYRVLREKSAGGGWGLSLDMTASNPKYSNRHQGNGR